MENLDTKFMKEISRIKTPEIFIGVARILKVRLVEDPTDSDSKSTERDFVDIFRDVMDNYHKSTRARKRELYKILKKANTAPQEELNADRTEDTETTESTEDLQ